MGRCTLYRQKYSHTKFKKDQSTQRKENPLQNQHENEELHTDFKGAVIYKGKSYT